MLTKYLLELIDYILLLSILDKFVDKIPTLMAIKSNG